MEEADIAALRHEGTAVEDDNNPAHDNFMQSDGVLTTPSSLTIDVEPQLDFWSQLEWYMIENKLDEDTEARRVDGRHLRARRGTLGDHEIVTAPK